MTSARFDAIVIGAGANGLVAAAVLAHAGSKVLVLERADDVGGMHRTIEIAPGFRAPLGLDAGWAPPAVARGLGLSLPPSTAPATGVSVAHDGTFLRLSADARIAAEAIRLHSPRDADRWPAFTTRLGKLAAFLGALYQLPPPDIDTTSIGDLASLVGVGRKFRALGRDDMTEMLRVLPMSIEDFLGDEFDSAAVKAAVGAGGVQGIRQGPRSGATTYVLLHHLVGAVPGSVRARPWWTRGPGVFVAEVEALARKHGAIIRTSTAVARIDVRDDKVAGVTLESGDVIEAPLVLSTADPSRTLLRLVDPVWLDPELLRDVANIKYRGATAVIHYALDALPEARGLDAADLSSIVSLTSHLDDIERAYDAAKYGGVSPVPHVEVGVPSLRWSSLAPSGKHVLVARASYVPYAPKGAPWNAESTQALGDVVTRRIAESFPGFADRVLHRTVLTPRDIEARFGTTEGTLTHGELTLDQILFMRPVAGLGRYAMPIDGLFLGGAGAHPGPNVPGGAGWLAARTMLSSRGKGRKSS